MAETQGPRSPEDVRKFFAGWIDGSNAGDWDRVVELMDPEIVLRDPMLDAPARGHLDALLRVKGQYEPFPDGRLEMLGDPFLALEEPVLAYRWRFTGTHLHPIDPPGFAPTGRRVQVEGMSALRFRDQRVVDVRLFFDSSDVARQLLAAPPAGSPLEKGIAFAQRLRARRSRRARAASRKPGS